MYKMQPNDPNDPNEPYDPIDEYPPDTPLPDNETPRLLTPSMRTDSYLPNFPESPHLRPVVQTRRRHKKIKWGPGRCRPSRRHRRPPPPPPPPAAATMRSPQRTMTIAAHGGRKTLKNRSRNGSRKCKSTRRK